MTNSLIKAISALEAGCSTMVPSSVAAYGTVRNYASLLSNSGKKFGTKKGESFCIVIRYE